MNVIFMRSACQDNMHVTLGAKYMLYACAVHVAGETDITTFAHVICRFHLYLHACSTHVSCNMHGFGTFSMHATCMLHDMHVTCVKQLRIKTGDWEVKNRFPHLCTRICTHIYRFRWDGVSIRLNVESFRTNTYMIYLTYTFFNMHQTCHVTYMKHACHLPSACHHLKYACNIHVTCMLHAQDFV